MWDDGAAVDAHHVLGAPGLGGMVLLLVLLVLTATASAMIAGALARQDERVRRANSRKAIFEKVEKVLKEARTLSGPAQVPAAQNVMNMIGEHLNPAFMLAGGVNDPAGRLRKALGGKTTDPINAEQPGLRVPVAGGSAPIVVITSGGAPNPGAASAAASSGAGGASVSVTGGGGTDVGVLAQPQVYSLRPVANAKPPEPVERDMSWKERQDAVQRSLDDLAAFWKRDNVEVLLTNAQRALCDVKLPPRPPGR